MALSGTSTAMDSIKLRMQNLKMERDNAVQEAAISIEKQNALQTALSDNRDKIEKLSNELQQVIKISDDAHEKLESVNSVLRKRNEQVDELQLKLDSTERRKLLLEKQLDETEQKLSRFKTLIDDLTGTNDQNRMSLQVAEMSATDASDKLEDLETRLIVEANKYSEISDKYQDSCRKLNVLTRDFEKTQGRLEIAESKLAKVDEELKRVTDENQSLRVSQSKLSDRETHLEADLAKCKARVETAEHSNEKAEREVSKYKKQCKNLEVLLDQERLKIKSMKDEMEIALNGIV